MYSRYKIVIKNYLFVKKKKKQRYNRCMTDINQILNRYQTNIKQI